MARLVVLRFENDEDAEQFVKWGYKNEEAAQSLEKDVFVPSPSFDWLPERWTIEGMFQAPTKFCDCAHRGDGWRYSGKHNWWLHHSCGRPSVAWGSNIRTIIATGHDLTEKQTKQNTQERIDMVGMRCPECGQPREGYE